MGGKIRVKPSGAKGKRWQKGSSCASNPPNTAHRKSARTGFFRSTPGAGQYKGDGGVLTETALQTHDNTSSMEERTTNTETASAVSSQSWKTFATDYTDCSNPAFSKFLRNFRTTSAMHKEMLAVLAAIAEIIKSQGGKETEVEYFGALMTTLEVTEAEQSVAAILALLHLTMRRLPLTVLRFKFSAISKKLFDLLGRHAESDNVSILKNIFACLSTLLRAQDQSTWNDPVTLQIYSAILAFCTHSKPKVRKMAQTSVCGILRASQLMLSEKPPLVHPASAVTAKYVAQQVHECGLAKNTTTVLHLLSLLKDVLMVFPSSQLKSTCELLLQLMSLKDAMTSTCCLQVYYSLFTSRPSDKLLSPQLNAQIISALYDYIPSVNDVGSITSWISVMQEAHANLFRLDENLCMGHLQRLFKVLCDCWLSSHSEVLSAVATCLDAVIKDCLQPSQARLYSEYRKHAERMFASVEQCLKYQYHKAWKPVLHVLGQLFKALGKDFQECMLQCLTTLAQLRDTEQFPYQDELDLAVGKAVGALGPRVVLSAIPLLITATEEDDLTFPRGWLLIVMRKHIANTELKFFIEYFLPLAIKSKARAEELSATRYKSEPYDVIQAQIWSLLPSFCNQPTDLCESFKGIARTLGVALSEKKELRMPVLQSLRMLVSQNLENDGNRNELARFAKNYLPILFNLYLIEPMDTEAKGVHLAVLETIRAYLQISDLNLVHSVFDKAVERLPSESAAFTKECLMDLLLTMLPYLDTTRLHQLFSFCVPLLAGVDLHMQKKSYRVLEEICAGKSESSCTFVLVNLDNLQRILLTSLSSASLSAKAPRLRCLRHILPMLRPEHQEFIGAVVPEAVLCCKGNNKKAREAAFSLIVEMGNTMQRLSGSSGDMGSRAYMKLLLAGLAGSPTLVSATLLAIGTLMHARKDSFPRDLVELVLDNLYLLLTTATREIVKAGLSLLKVIVSSVDTDFVARQLRHMVLALVNMTEDCKRKMRTETKHILSRLLRKFGYEAVRACVPGTEVAMLKRLRNLQKEKTREGRRTEARDEEDGERNFNVKAQARSMDELLAQSDDSETEEKSEVSRKLGKKQRKQGGASWIQENPNSIVDFMDPKAAQSILACNPSSIGGNKTNNKRHFNTAPDGRLIISEESTGQGYSFSSDDSGDEAALQPEGSNRKRKLPEDKSSVVGPSRPKYKAGGQGIHRPLGLTVSTNVKGAVGPSKKKRAKGESKEKRKLDPYAYVPLSKQLLNRRKKAKLSGQFKGLVKGAKKGAVKGRRATRSRLKRK